MEADRKKGQFDSINFIADTVIALTKSFPLKLQYKGFYDQGNYSMAHNMGYLNSY